MTQRPCGNPECCVTMHIGDCLSFGSGEEDNGFWEQPCRICAEHAETRDRAAGKSKNMPYWPTAKYMEKTNGESKNLDRVVPGSVL